MNVSIPFVDTGNICSELLFPSEGHVEYHTIPLQTPTTVDVNSSSSSSSSSIQTDVSWFPNYLKDKSGKIPTLSNNDRIFIDMMKRSLFFPFPFSGMKLEEQKQKLGKTDTKSNKPKKAMNIFVIFRSYFCSTAKRTLPNPLNGTDLSRIASYMWNGASADEKSSYQPIAEFLKAEAPAYVEKRIRKRNFHKFIDYNVIKKHSQKNPDIPSQVNTGGPIRIKELKKEKHIAYYSPSLNYNLGDQRMIDGYDAQVVIQQQQQQPYQQQYYFYGNDSAGTYNWSYDNDLNPNNYQ